MRTYPPCWVFKAQDEATTIASLCRMMMMMTPLRNKNKNIHAKSIVPIYTLKFNKIPCFFSFHPAHDRERFD